MQVRDLMSTDVVTVHREASLREAVATKLSNEVGSVIVVNDDHNPVGIVTETDALRAAYKTGESLRIIPVEKLASGPVITTKPSASVALVAKRMASNGVKYVPVMDDLDLAGIISHSDIVWHLPALRKHASAYKSMEKEWSSKA